MSVLFCYKGLLCSLQVFFPQELEWYFYECDLYPVTFLLISFHIFSMVFEYTQIHKKIHYIRINRTLVCSVLLYPQPHSNVRLSFFFLKCFLVPFTFWLFHIIYTAPPLQASLKTFSMARGYLISLSLNVFFSPGKSYLIYTSVNIEEHEYFFKTISVLFHLGHMVRSQDLFLFGLQALSWGLLRFQPFIFYLELLFNFNQFHKQEELMITRFTLKYK